MVRKMVKHLTWMLAMCESLGQLAVASSVCVLRWRSVISREGC